LFLCSNPAAFVCFDQFQHFGVIDQLHTKSLNPFDINNTGDEPPSSAVETDTNNGITRAWEAPGDVNLRPTTELACSDFGLFATRAERMFFLDISNDAPDTFLVVVVGNSVLGVPLKSL